MAFYKKKYHDIHIGKATYTISGIETKTVLGKSQQNYNGGMKLTVESGQLEIRAKTLKDYYWYHADIDWTKNSHAGTSTIGLSGANLNFFAAFHVGSFIMSCATAINVTSYGRWLWGNYNAIQVLYTLSGKKSTVEVEENRTLTKKVLNAVKFVSVKNHDVRAGKSNYS